MHQVQLNERLCKEAERRAAEAGFSTVDEYVADRLESDFSDAREDFDDRFTPQVVARLDQISDQMKAGQSVSVTAQNWLAQLEAMLHPEMMFVAA
jgi:hypothetical protein